MMRFNEQDGVHLTIVDTYLLFNALDYVKMGWLDGYKSTIPYFSYRTRRSQANQTFQLSVTLCIPNGRSRETPACPPVCVLASRRVVATVIGWSTKHWKLSSIWKWVIGVLKTRLITLTMTSRPS